MNCKNILVALVVLFVLNVGLPQQAHAGFILFNCYDAPPISAGPGANPTVGCQMRWFPGGFGIRAAFAVGFACSPNCVVTPATWASPVVSITGASSSLWREIVFNCAGAVNGSVGGAAESLKYGPGSTRGAPLVTDETFTDFAVGFLGTFCPQTPVGSGAQSL